ncbi:MAG: FimB/Mfa2 family fimbrial subunit [Porphyromonas sp.]|nr:FimB/Mfa2 family fimbrial subunit [Porphyromonas sp.]
MKRNLYTAVLVACALPLLVACSSLIFEDYSDCPISSGRLLFEYEADGEANVLPQYIHNAVLFIYDLEGTLVYEAELSDKELNSPQGLTLPTLPPGSYRVIVWGNADHSSFENRDQLSSATLTAANSAAENDPLYFASEVIKGEGEPIQHMVHFSSAHIKIEIVCRYFSALYGEGFTPVIEISSTACHYLFDQSGIPLPTDEVRDYQIPVNYSASDDSHTARFAALRFTSDDTSIMVRMRHPETDEVLAEVDLKEYIKNLTPPLEERQEATISIELVCSALGVTITPPVWEGGEITPNV